MCRGTNAMITCHNSSKIKMNLSCKPQNGFFNLQICWKNISDHNPNKHNNHHQKTWPSCTYPDKVCDWRTKQQMIQDNNAPNPDNNGSCRLQGPMKMKGLGEVQGYWKKPMTTTSYLLLFFCGFHKYHLLHLLKIEVWKRCRITGKKPTTTTSYLLLFFFCFHKYHLLHLTYSNIVCLLHAKAKLLLPSDSIFDEVLICPLHPPKHSLFSLFFLTKRNVKIELLCANWMVRPLLDCWILINK